MENKRVPEVRFEGFSEDWEERKLGDFIKSMHGGASIAPDDYQEEGVSTVPKGAVNYSGIANLSGSKFVSEGFYQKNIKASVYSGDLVTSLRDLVPTAPNMGRIVKLLGESKKYLMPQGVYRLLLEEGVDENFMIAFSNSDKFRKIISQGKNGSTQVHIRNSEYLGIKLKAPNSKEQTKIGTFFKQLDDAIALHQHELTTLKQTKQGFLQKMFPKEGESVPEVRFPGFSGEWEERMLGEILKVNSGKDYKHLQQGDIPVYGTSGYMLSVNGKLSDENAIGIGRKGTIDHPQLLKAPFWTVDTLFFMTTKEKNDLLFCYSLANKINWKKYDESTGVPSLSKASIVKISVRIPTSAEQEKIGNFFKQLDDTIALHQRELDALKVTKKAFLQKMFV
ncbi:restriction endonuclease subunit S [Bacillus subtilis]|uniref:restriction endonuclease subunit S n=1 Tax=Bacillus subtilis TaxID=1423 RepID=UPI00059E028C|nr:restriction endonuclease subunit S [Bacillus subtilis]KIN35285.1 Type I restriction-modification system, specificity subunit S [Bacillus subtilis]MBO3766981.1 restriction endonuclease subunit S [Bacillus subtilis]ODV46068.1 restriction endonuclease subunit S [Bacillus subtilis]OJH62227.1 restriction endonuclease subunit S [Bacillus subtilis]OTQ82866.1 restriction modification system DNA specificity subunit [Bacillus subtilis subsp. subtilis]